MTGTTTVRSRLLARCLRRLLPLCSTFVVTNEIAETHPGKGPGESPTVTAIRLKFYLVR